jgi:hypothetical protein
MGYHPDDDQIEDFECPYCNHEFKAQDAHVAAVSCPKCGEEVASFLCGGCDGDDEPCYCRFPDEEDDEPTASEIEDMDIEAAIAWAEDPENAAP